MKRILVYSHDTYGLGNIRRMLCICEHLRAVHPDVSILIVSGSPMLHAFRVTPRIDYIKLPCLTRTEVGDYQVRSLGLSYEATIRMRRDIVTAAVAEFEPDLVLVDKKPFGVDEELRPGLEAAAAGARPPAMVLLLRDILDDPGTTVPIWQKNRYYDAIETHFDSVLVLGSQDVFDLPAAYRFPAAVSAKVEFCGYLGRTLYGGSQREARATLGVETASPLVLVTPGGGEDGARLTDCFSHIVATNNELDFEAIVVAGPEMPDEAIGRLRELALGRKGVRVVRFTDDMATYIAAADLVVSMAGYNTVCEILSAGRPAIVVPRARPVREQLMRAELLAGLGIVDMVHPDALTPPALHRAISGALHRALDRGRGRADYLDLCGLERVEKHLAGLLGDG